MELNIVATSLGGGFFGGIVIGYALKKVAKLTVIVVGMFLAGLAYLQYQGIASLNWNKLQSLTQGAANAAILHNEFEEDYSRSIVVNQPDLKGDGKM
jgi:uncharacterized membrane protein (Fun14 family)